MRSIKFKGMAISNDKHNGIKRGDFVTGSFIESNIDCQIIWGDGEQMEIDRKTLGQFTGFIDRDKKEIFEGDVLMIVESIDGNYISSIFKKRVVSWHRLGWCLQPMDRVLSCPKGMYLSDTEEWSVIGNIHEEATKQN